MLYFRHGNTSLLGDFWELLPYRFLDGRLRELGTNVVGLVMEFWRPPQGQFQVQRKDAFQGIVEDRFKGLCVPEHKPTFICQVDDVRRRRDGPIT